MAHLNQLTMTEAAARLARRECSSEEIVRDILAAIEKTDQQVGAYLTVNAEDALAQARAADAARAAGPTARWALRVRLVVCVRTARGRSEVQELIWRMARGGCASAQPPRLFGCLARLIVTVALLSEKQRLAHRAELPLLRRMRFQQPQFTGPGYGRTLILQLFFQPVVIWRVLRWRRAQRHNHAHIAVVLLDVNICAGR